MIKKVVQSHSVLSMNTKVGRWIGRFDSRPEPTFRDCCFAAPKVQAHSTSIKSSTSYLLAG